MKNNIGLLILTACIVGVGGFFVGMKYQQTKVPTGMPGAMQQFGGGNRNGQIGGSGGNRFGQNGANRATIGEIISTDDKSITVKLTDGSSKIVLLSDKTSINKASEGSKEDLKTGVTVAAFGSTNSDGSVTATNVQINPMMGGREGGAGRQPNQAAKSTDAREIVVTGGNYSFSPNTITVKKGEKTRIVFKNNEGFHDFKVDELNLSTAVINAGQEDFVEFTPDKAGVYEFYCSVGNHRQMGMKGTITIQ